MNLNRFRDKEQALWHFWHRAASFSYMDTAAGLALFGAGLALLAYLPIISVMLFVFGFAECAMGAGWLPKWVKE